LYTECVTDGISRQAKITCSPRSDRWPDLLATNDNVTCICPRSYHCGNKQSQHDRAMHHPLYISDKNNVHTRQKFNLQGARERATAFGIILHARAVASSSTAIPITTECVEST